MIAAFFDTSIKNLSVAVARSNKPPKAIALNKLQFNNSFINRIPKLATKIKGHLGLTL